MLSLIKQLQNDPEPLLAIKQYLDDLPKKDKGSVFERLVAELYKGNGYTVLVNGGRGDCGADLLVFAESASKPLKIVQCKNHIRPITKDGVILELMKFENEASVKYECNSFEIISVNGFVESCLHLQRFNVLLSDLKSLQGLIDNYGKKKSSCPTLQLNGYNADTYQKLESSLKNSNRACVVQATGTGKRYLAGKYILQRKDKRILFLSPSLLINEQQQRLVPWLNCAYMTYSGLMCASRSGEIQPNTYDCIIVDEFHRAGSDKWGAAVKELLTANPNAELIGLTATPKRYCDQGLDMRDVLFNGTCVSEINLHDAIARKILKAPIYVTSLYDIESYSINTRTKIDSSNLDEHKKNDLLDESKKIIVDWRNSMGVEHVLNKYLDKIEGKYVVFCEDIDHMYSMVEDVRRWFRYTAEAKGVGRVTINHSIVHSELGRNEARKILAQFESATGEKEIHLLFSVNMLNEGLHVKGVTRAIMLRKTQSPTLHLQQIGRVLATDSEESPVIFDLVNNIVSMGAHDFASQTNEAIEREKRERLTQGLDISADYVEKTKVVVHDELVSLSQFLNKLKLLSSDWGVAITKLKKFIKENGHCSVPKKYNDGELKLGTWVESRRSDYKKGNIPQHRIDELNEIGFIWDVYKYDWDLSFAALVKFKEEHGHCAVPQKYTHGSINLGKWVGRRRDDRKKNALEAQKIKKLNEIGFIWNVHDYEWDLNFAALIKFKEEHGHCAVSRNTKYEGLNIGVWVDTRRAYYKKGIIEQKKIDELNEIGFIWDSPKYEWNLRVSALIKFKEDHGHCLVPKSYQVGSLKLGSWVDNRRNEFKNGKIDQKKIDELNEIGFIWDAPKYEWEQNMSALMKFKEEHGHCYVPHKHMDGDNKLGVWVVNRRMDLRRGGLTKSKIDALNKIGFIWDGLKHEWEQNVSALVKFKKEHGHCLPSRSYKLNGVNLGKWVATRRNEYRKGTLEQHKIDELNGLGFVWRVKV